jgi:hypothetical protein
LFLFSKVNYEHKQAATILKIKEQISSVAKLSLKGLPQKEIILAQIFLQFMTVEDVFCLKE